MLIFTTPEIGSKGESDVGFWGDGEIDILAIANQATPDMLFPIKKKHIVLKKQTKHTKQIAPKKRYRWVEQKKRQRGSDSFEEEA
jgi:hypothetical protein